MAKTNITLYSSTPSSNTDINNINIDENCPASGLNNAIRELMAHLKNVDTGSQALTALSVTGDLTVDTSTLYVDSANNRVGIGTTSPDGRLHVHTASAGSVTANSDADDLVVENNGHAGINILSPDANRSAIQFGHTSDNLQLQIRHDGGTSLSQIISDDPIALWTNGSERMRVDSSGNLLVGTTNSSVESSSTDEGVNIFANKIGVARDGGVTANFNRLTSDGDIMKFRKDGTTVGSIGTQGGTLEVGSGDVYLQFNGTNEWIKPVDGAGSNKANVDLGTSGARFKDLYLSGGAYIGGTGSANKLDDYEEGIVTATLSPDTSGTITLNATNNHLAYTKVGRMVTITGLLVISSVSSPTGTYVRVLGLPFAVVDLDGHAERTAPSITYFDHSAASYSVQPSFATGNVSEFRVYKTPNTWAANDSFYINFSYFTA